MFVQNKIYNSIVKRPLLTYLIFMVILSMPLEIVLVNLAANVKAFSYSFETMYRYFSLWAGFLEGLLLDGFIVLAVKQRKRKLKVLQVAFLVFLLLTNVIAISILVKSTLAFCAGTF